MAEWYVRRGEKVIGPFEITKLKDLATAGKILPTDLLAKDAAGPWKEAASTTLFAATTPPKPPEQIPAQDRSTTLVQTTERLPVVIEPAQGNRVILATRSFFTSFGRGSLSVWTVVTRSLSTRSQRKHELKLAKIQADALAKAFADSHQPPAPQQAPRPIAQPQPVVAAQPPITFAPQIVQTTIVKVENKNAGGCSGCALLLLLILIVIIAFIIYAGTNPPR
jgi:hypothetical protein